MTVVDLFISEGGDVGAVYDDAVDFATLGEALGGGVEARCDIARASHVEPAETWCGTHHRVRDGLCGLDCVPLEGKWCADLDPVGGPVLEGFRTREQALQAEREWLVRTALGRLP